MGKYEVTKAESPDIFTLQSAKTTTRPNGDPVPSSRARGQWGGQLEFILTCVGFAVGLGNVWRFPYLCYKNGGGAFLIPYFTMLVLAGVPLFYLEIAFGQFASLGPIAIWTINPLMKGLGYTMVTCNLLVALYYNVIIAWSVHYFFSSMTNALPWETCDNVWNTYLCTDIRHYDAQNISNVTGNIALRNISRDLLKSPSEEYFYRHVLRMSSGVNEVGSVQWQLALCLLFVWSVEFAVLIKGVASLGKVVYFSSIFPYILLTVMLVRGVTLDGAMEGIRYYLSPDFGYLLNAKVWNEAATQIFYSLSVCSGGIIAMASYSKFNNNCYRDSILVPTINCGTSFYAGFVIFSVLGFMAQNKGVPISDVASGGPGLVFIVYPEALTRMPIAPLWSTLFFFMLMTLGFSSEFSMLECFFSALSDEYPEVLSKTRRRNIVFRACTCAVCYAVTLIFVTNGGFYLVNLLDTSLGGFPLLVVGMFEVVTISFLYGYSNFELDISMMLGKKPNFYYRLCLCVIAPLLLFATIVFMAVQYRPLTLDNTYVYPPWSLYLWWTVAIVPISFIPLGVIVVWCRLGGLQALQEASFPRPRWGPALNCHRTGSYASTDDMSYTLKNCDSDQVTNTVQTTNFVVKKDCVNSNKNGQANEGFKL